MRQIARRLSPFPTGVSVSGRRRSHYDRLYVLRRRRIMLAVAAGNARAAYVEAPHLYPGDLTMANPPVLCWQCGEPLATCGPNRNGRHLNGGAAKWTAGHTVDGDNTSPIVPECSPCNFSRGAAAGNRRRRAGRGVGSRRGVLAGRPQDPARGRPSDSDIWSVRDPGGGRP